MKKEWSAGKIIGLAVGIFAAVIVLWVAFVASVFWLVNNITKIEESSSEEWIFEEEEPVGEVPDKEDIFEEPPEDPFYQDDRNPDDGIYYEFESAIRDDLSYQVSVNTYQNDEFPFANNSKALLSFEYAQITGDIPNLEGINKALYEEIDLIEEHISSSEEFLSDGDEYVYTGTCYVTYMSEEILSVAYVEYGYLNSQYVESYVISLNFDMKTGMLLGNTNLVEVNDNFSIDFRERCEAQNGEIAGLSILSDQEITEYLSDGDYLIVFYTPLGMEIGFNYYDGWVTVTYQDYEKFTKQF